MKKVNMACGPVAVNDLGVTLMHEHIVYGYTGWYADSTIAPDDKVQIAKVAVKTLKEIKELGVKTIVDATPADSGRDVELIKEVSEKSGVNIVCPTGLYYEGEGGAAYWKSRILFGTDVPSEIYEMFMQEITVGIGKTGIKAGVIKLGTSQGMITDYEKVVFKAAARASKETGVPIITHTQGKTMGPEQAALLVSEGVNPKSVMIGHYGDSLEINDHLQILSHGVSVGFDRMGLQGNLGYPADADRCAVIAELIKKGYVDRIMLGHDSVSTWLGRPLTKLFADAFPNWYPTNVHKNIIPLLKKLGVTDAQINTMLVDNPRRIFAGE